MALHIPGSGLRAPCSIMALIRRELAVYLWKASSFSALSAALFCSCLVRLLFGLCHGIWSPIWHRSFVGAAFHPDCSDFVDYRLYSTSQHSPQHSQLGTNRPLPRLVLSLRFLFCLPVLSHRWPPGPVIRDTIYRAEKRLIGTLAGLPSCREFRYGNPYRYVCIWHATFFVRQRIKKPLFTQL